MSLSFQYPAGASSDVKELEYIAALHQTSSELRPEGSIHAIDIVHFLKSRYGIEVTEDEVRKTILAGLGGGDDEEECIDMIEIVAILLIPYFLKASQQQQQSEILSPEIGSSNSNREPLVEEEGNKDDDDGDDDNVEPSSRIIEEVLDMILRDVTGDSNVTTNRHPIILDKNIVSDILHFYGEKEIANDDKLLEEMISVAKGGGDDEDRVELLPSSSSVVYLDAKSFARGLTFDVKKYNVDSEMSLTTNYYDVFKTKYSSRDIREIMKARHRDEQMANNEPTVLSPPPVSALQSSVDDGGDIEMATITREERNDDIGVSSSSSQIKRSARRDATTTVNKSLSSSLTKSLLKAVKFTFNNDDDDDDGITNTTVRFVHTIPSIDYTSDTFGSVIYVSTLWTCFVSTYIAYFYKPSELQLGELNCSASLTNSTGTEDDVYELTTLDGKTFFCLIAESLIHWIFVFFELSLFGLLFMAGGSMGYDIYSDSKIQRLIGMACVVLFTVVPPYVEVNTLFFTTVVPTNPLYKPVEKTLRFCSFFLGCILLVMQIHLFVVDFLSPWLFHRGEEEEEEDTNKEEDDDYDAAADDTSPFTKGCCARYERKWWSIFVVNDSIRREASIKRATAKKIDKMVRNALAICRWDDMTSRNAKTNQGRALLNFMKHGKKAKTTSSSSSDDDVVGGHFWTLKTLFSGELYGTHGVWVSGRVFAGTAALLVANIFVVSMAFYLLKNVMMTVKNEVENSTNGGVTYKTFASLYVSAIIGAIVAILTAFGLTSTYIPSSVSTILKLRSGIIPSLHHVGFNEYRKGIDTVMYIIGCMFWGVWYSSIVLGFFWFGLLLFFLSPGTRTFALQTLAWLLGLSITLSVKQAAFYFLRRRFTAGFYRKKPRQFNIIGLMLECWSIGTSIGFMLVRTLKLALSTILYIGRIDTPIMAPGVGFMGFELDTYPDMFRKDILIHEAHRHPYIERLGIMYMMKLRYGAKFATTGGTIWRMLFVFALMPWLRKYRIMTRRPDDDDGGGYDVEIDEESERRNDDDDGDDQEGGKDNNVSSNAVVVVGQQQQPRRKRRARVRVFRGLRRHLFNSGPKTV